MDEPQEHHAEQKEPDTKEPLLHDSVYVRHPEEANPWSLGGCQGLGTGDKESDCVTGTGLLRVMKTSWNETRGDGYVTS